MPTKQCQKCEGYGRIEGVFCDCSMGESAKRDTESWERRASTPPPATVSRDLEGKLRELAEFDSGELFPLSGCFDQDALVGLLGKAAALGRAEGLSELNDAKRMAMEYREAWYKVMAERDEAIRALKEKHVEL